MKRGMWVPSGQGWTGASSHVISKDELRVLESPSPFVSGEGWLQGGMNFRSWTGRGDGAGQRPTRQFQPVAPSALRPDLRYLSAPACAGTSGSAPPAGAAVQPGRQPEALAGDSQWLRHPSWQTQAGRVEGAQRIPGMDTTLQPCRVADPKSGGPWRGSFPSGRSWGANENTAC